MKKIIFSMLVLSSALQLNAQNVNIPDSNFKNVLLSIQELNTNGDNEIQENEAASYEEVLHIPQGDISDLTGLEAFTEIIGLVINPNPNITSLELYANTELHFLACFGTGISTLDLSDRDLVTVSLVDNANFVSLNAENSIMTYLSAQSNALSIASFAGSNIGTLTLSNNDFQELDFGSTQIENLDVSNSPVLSYMNLKNGFEENFISLSGLQNLELVCIENLGGDLEAEYEMLFPSWTGFIDDCNVDPNVYLGHLLYDINEDGCDATDMPLSNALVQSTNGIISKALQTEDDGSFEMPLYIDGEYTTSVIGLPDYFSVNPGSVVSSFTGFGNTEELNFCITALEDVKDVDVTLVSIFPARPGFTAKYQLIFKNMGTNYATGNVSLNFDASKMSFSDSTSDNLVLQGVDNLTADFVNLGIFETKAIDVSFEVYETTEIGELVSFTATATQEIPGEESIVNQDEIHEVVIGSFDPNDVTVMEGEHLPLSSIDDYLHYRIRFQNTGTAEAINILVENTLDDHLDWTTFQLLSTSHDSHFEIENGNQIDFIFNNIDLPAEMDDEPNSHGYIIYRIKPLDDISVGSLIQNQASIFFDFNEPIITNIATTYIGQPEIVEPLGLDDNGTLSYKVFPVPVSGILNIESQANISKVEITNDLGQVLMVEQAVNQLDLSSLARGLYFVKVIDDQGNSGVQKIIKQ